MQSKPVTKKLPKTLTTDTSSVIIGRFGKTHGVCGWIKVISFTDPVESVLDYAPWTYLQKQNQATIKIEDHKWHSDQLLVKLEGYDSPEDVRSFTNREIMTVRSNLPPLADDKVYLLDLPGLIAINLQDETLGVIEKHFDSGAHLILDIRGDQHYLIPFVRDMFIQSIDLGAGIIRVDWASDHTA